MLVTELGIVMEVREEQPENAYSPMLVTELGRVTEVREWQLENASLPMLIYPSSISEVITSNLSNPSFFTSSVVNTFSSFIIL